ncbi:MAG: exodeoxyribonuclease VII large subunit, partial [Chloroflexi bacterium]|nr:exodeoxyribonuclease VII large subunit [Chloroflexota bacterium]
MPAAEDRLGVLTVGEVTRRVRDALRADPVLRDVWVEGEVGRVSISSAGHAYFSLKDDHGVLDCVVFARELSQATFEPRTGLRVLAHGRVEMYEQQGRVQLYVDALRPAGVGDLALRFEALKARLAAEGLFDPARRRPLPARPRRVAVITSPTGAVWHDVRTVVARRWPLAELVLVPCLVQGDAAPPTIVGAFARVAALPAADLPDVVILARGGGTLEDLWAFNAEAVV